jgi:DNA polymerase III epsilon subunit-like protein
MSPLTALLLLASAALPAWAAARWVRRRRPAPGVPLRRLDFVAIDIETTGLDPRRDQPVALAAVPFAAGRPRLDAACIRLVNPGRPIPPAAQAIHGIRDADVREAPAVAAALPEFLAACRGRAIIAHTAHFDLEIINRAARAAGFPALRDPVLDVGALAHGLFPSWWDLTLEGLGRLVEVEPIDRHTARGDALTAGAIFLRMIPLLEQRGIGTLSAALTLQRRAALIPAGPGATGGGLAGP